MSREQLHIEVIAVVEMWEQKARANLLLDGPLEYFAKRLLVQHIEDYIAQLLGRWQSAAQALAIPPAETSSEPELGPAKRRGRPPRSRVNAN